MKERIIHFLATENKTSAQFAEEIGVQPSGISHILSGRNNPSLDFVLKMLTRYNYISPEWLLFGKEPMYRRNVAPTLFDHVFAEEPEKPGKVESDTPSVNLRDDYTIHEKEKPADPASEINDTTLPLSSKTRKIVFFYSDNSFEEYIPG